MYLRFSLFSQCIHDHVGRTGANLFGDSYRATGVGVGRDLR